MPAPPTGEDPARRTSARGTQRRALLVRAAADLLGESGFAAVTHRAVAARAQLPLAATTYYFTGLDELLEAAVRHLADAWLEGARRAADAPVGDGETPAERLVRVGALGAARAGGQDAAVLLSLYERYVEAARHPSLRPVVAAYDAQVEALLADLLARNRETAGVPAGLVLAVVDGSVVRALAEGLDPARAAVEAVQELLDRTAPSRS